MESILSTGTDCNLNESLDSIAIKSCVLSEIESIKYSFPPAIVGNDSQQNGSNIEGISQIFNNENDSIFSEHIPIQDLAMKSDDVIVNFAMDNNTECIYSSIHNGTFWNCFSLSLSTADGHCALYSILSSLWTPFANYDSKLSNLKQIIMKDCKEHSCKCLNFLMVLKKILFLRLNNIFVIKLITRSSVTFSH